MEIQWVGATRGYYFIHPTKKMKNNALWVGPFKSLVALQSAIKTEFGEDAEIANYDPVAEYDKTLRDVVREIVKEKTREQEAKQKQNAKIVSDVLAFMNR